MEDEKMDGYNGYIRDSKVKTPEAPKPVVYPNYPERPSEREMMRQDMLLHLNHWDNNDPDLARATAKTFIELLKRQFDLPSDK